MIGIPAWLAPVWRYLYLLVFLVTGVLVVRIHIGTPTSMYEWFLGIAMLPVMAVLGAGGALWAVGLLLVLLVVSLVREKTARNRWLTSLGPSFVLVIFVLCGTGVARSVALEFSLDELNEAIAQLEEHSRFPAQKVGVYQVDQAAIDERGGVYFRINTGGGFGPAHYLPVEGLALNPNSQGSPFVGEDWSYRTKRVKGEWFWFTQRMLRKN